MWNPIAIATYPELGATIFKSIDKSLYGKEQKEVKK